MGSVSIGMVDESSPLYNPAAMGIFHFDNFLGVSKSNKTEWLPVLTDDIFLTSQSTSVGASLKQLMPESRLPFDISFGVAASILKIDFDKITITNEQGMELGKFTAYEEAKVTSFGLGIKRIVRLGFGYSHKKVSGISPAIGPGREIGIASVAATAHDWSFTAQLPIYELMDDYLRLFDNDHDFSLSLTPSYAYVKANIGDSVTGYSFSADELLSLPESVKKSWSIYASLGFRGASILSLNLLSEVEQLGPSEKTAKGSEFGIGGFYFIRNGTLNDPDGHVDIDTKGWGFSLRGLLDLARQIPLIGDVKGPLGFILDRIDLRVDHAEYPEIGQVLDGMEFTNWSISL